MTWRSVPPSQSMEGWDADTEAVHAADQTVADDALRRWREHPSDWAGAGHRTEHGARVSGPGDSGGARLAVGRRRHRREPGGTAVRQRRRACRGALPRRARLAGTGTRTQTTWRQPAGTVGRIS